MHSMKTVVAVVLALATVTTTQAQISMAGPSHRSVAGSVGHFFKQVVIPDNEWHPTKKQRVMQYFSLGVLAAGSSVNAIRAGQAGDHRGVGFAVGLGIFIGMSSQNAYKVGKTEPAFWANTLMGGVQAVPAYSYGPPAKKP